MNYDIDKVDERIIYNLEKNSKESTAPKIAEELDVSPSTIRKRIDKLEDLGIIKGYHAEIDYHKCGQRLTHIIVCTAPVSDREKLAKQALKIPGVVNVREIMSGKRNIRIKIVGEDNREIIRTTQKLTNLGLEVVEEDLLHNEYFSSLQKFGPEKQYDQHQKIYMNLKEGEELTEIMVDEETPISGMTLEKANQKGLIPENILVVAIKREDEIITPKGGTQIKVGDYLKVFSPDGTDIHELDTFKTKKPN